MKNQKEILRRIRYVIALLVLMCVLAIPGMGKEVHAEEDIYLYLHSNYGSDEVSKWKLTNMTYENITSTLFRPSFGNRAGYRLSYYSYDRKGLQPVPDGGFRYVGRCVYSIVDIYAASIVLREKPASDLVMYAQWEMIPYRIDYYCDGGVNSELNPAIYRVKDSITLEAPTRSGYDFTGWYTDETLKEKITEIPEGSTGDITLYAGWECNHTLTTIYKNYQAATCCNDGYMGDEYCGTCGKYVGEGPAIPATGLHSGVIVLDARESTCQEEGYTGNTYCVDSLKLISRGENIPVVGHDENVIKGDFAATCTEDGYSGDLYCSMCDTLQVKGSVIPASGHIGGEADCRHKAVCTICHEGYGDRNPDNHKNILTCNESEASCETKGYSGNKYCGDCNRLLEVGTDTPAKGHKWDAGIITKEPTYETVGEKVYTCTVCQKKKTEAIPVLVKDTTSGQKPTPTTGDSNNQNNSASHNNADGTEAAVDKVSSLKVKNDKSRSVKVSFKKVVGGKYQLQYSTDKKFKKSVKEKTLSKNSLTIKKLKKGKTYYVRVRAYKKMNGKTLYSGWVAQKVKIKK